MTRPTPCPSCGAKVRCEHRPNMPPASALNEQYGGDHYRAMAIQPVEYIHHNGIGFIEGNVIKYISRWRNKGGIDDLRKARHFIDLLIEMEGEK